MPPPIPLTLILAATPEMGIGFKGGLPWPSLKSEIAYFARVTRRAPLSHINAVIMGRRTWESIPKKFRPLKGRVNVVISRRPEKLNLVSEGNELTNEGVAISANDISDALTKLQEMYVRKKDGYGLKLSKVFVIGGAEIYTAALAMENAERILLTRMRHDFECDTFFPIKLESSTTRRELTYRDGKNIKDWAKASKAELDAWTGEEVPEGVRQERDVQWEFEMWETKRTDS